MDDDRQELEREEGSEGMGPEAPGGEPPEGWEEDPDRPGILVMRQSGTLWTEEWRVGPDLMEVHARTLGFGRPQVYEGARFEISMGGGGGGGSIHRLAIVKGAKRHVIAERQYGDEVRALGLFLSERTGWPLKTTTR